MAKINNTSDSSYWGGCGAKGKHPSIAVGRANLYSHFGNQYGSFSAVSHSWASTQRASYPPHHKDIYLSMFTAASFIKQRKL